MCNCLSEVTAQTKQLLGERSKDKSIISDVEVSNVGFIRVDNLLVAHPVLTVKYKAARFRKDGQPGKPQSAELSLVFTYCPFCGVAYELGRYKKTQPTLDNE